jgi:hypothetical protein
VKLLWIWRYRNNSRVGLRVPRLGLALPVHLLPEETTAAWGFECHDSPRKSDQTILQRKQQPRGASSTETAITALVWIVIHAKQQALEPSNVQTRGCSCSSLLW